MPSNSARSKHALKKLNQKRQHEKNLQNKYLQDKKDLLLKKIIRDGICSKDCIQKGFSEKFTFYLQCGHSFHLNCARKYIIQNINQQKFLQRQNKDDKFVFQFKCMNEYCGHYFDLKGLLDIFEQPIKDENKDVNQIICQDDCTFCDQQQYFGIKNYVVQINDEVQKLTDRISSKIQIQDDFQLSFQLACGHSSHIKCLEKSLLLQLEKGDTNIKCKQCEYYISNREIQIFFYQHQNYSGLSLQNNYLKLNECEICFENYYKYTNPNKKIDDIQKMGIQLQYCQKVFHLPCVQEYVIQNLKQCKFKINCLNEDCNHQIYVDEQTKILSSHIEQKYRTISTQSNPFLQELKLKYNQKERKTLLKAGLKQCPQCERFINKNGGCNHMTCQCTQQFCWICTQKYQPGHVCPENK
ncbi:hypothetical protein PPERSA_10615 [Pseudocohnilembus persalinus]|uniref:RBR-type E3 ubiquitin transferase n=1 Tax=Pseudocohnilembus persalinus TaxID=266149 RepID=A0A0V0R0D3_PSEPJ|nr:hypothetical protein PPERSA_10615 [Pseudocohnilembus persalinus]|eukprot:KRX07980.1 hypothetical protein PPERSA_10615 [Pseudocohnilembus persalinus]